MQMYTRVFVAVILISFLLSLNLIDLKVFNRAFQSGTPNSDNYLPTEKKQSNTLQTTTNKPITDKAKTPTQPQLQKNRQETTKENKKEEKDKKTPQKNANNQANNTNASISILETKQRMAEDSLLPQQEYTALAKMLAAMPIDYEPYKSVYEDKATKLHYLEFEKAWEGLKKQKLDKMQTWRDEELIDLNQQQGSTLFYPFSGPDFLNAYHLFPNCEYYLMFGLERIGELPKKDQMKPPIWANYLFSVRQALSELMQRNYFITARMSVTLNNPNAVKGVLPLICIFLARTDNEILSIQRVYLDKQGNATYTHLHDYSKKGLSGLYIVFLNKNKEKAQRLYYFSADLADAAMPAKKELINFIKAFDNKITLIKSASYLLHTTHFSTIRNLILDDTFACLQDDTGVPYSYYVKNNWDVQLYGKYDKPIRDFNYGYQLDLQQRFNTDKTIKPLNFTFGYHWWTDKSSILLCRKKKRVE
ncbi:MAG: hypothetical protein NZ551_03735 [Microscillaceae bacterium]|nr:hypothetical protein [Microscillaceae bacterium]MDW8460300.1 hypothetical protein [Cytophagales bacterium]